MVDLINKKVKHFGSFGVGIITEQDDKYITVQFLTKTCKFAYPFAFEKFITPEDRYIADAIDVELKSVKNTEEVAEVAKKAADEQTKLDKLKTKEGSLGKKISTKKAYTSVKRIDGQALTYLVFQGDTYNEERTGQFIWAPKYTKKGRTMHHWDRLMNVRKGDVIFHCSDGYIQAISCVRGACEDSARPRYSTCDSTNWENDGRRINCDYYVLNMPLKHGDYKEKILQYCNVKYAPFDKYGNGNMGYLFDLNKNLAVFFVQEISKKNPEVINLDFLKFLFVK